MSITAHQDLPVPQGQAIDPLRAVRRLGRRASRDGIYIGFIIALLSHFSAYAAPKYTMWEMEKVVDKMQTELHGYFVTAYDVDLLPEEEEQPAAAADEEDEDDEEIVDDEEDVEDEEVEDDPVEQQTPEPQTQDDQEEPDDAEDDEPVYDDEEEAPPDTAEAADIATAPEEGPVDLSNHFTMVDKDGSKSTGGGYTSSGGKSKRAVKNPNARTGGKGKRRSKGKGKGKGKKRKKRGRDLSRGLRGSTQANCPHPPQADLHQIDKATVVLSVTVSSSGRVTSASVVSDPGYGFGSAAKRCVMAMRFPPALDRDGKAITKTGPMNFRFNRR